MALPSAEDADKPESVTPRWQNNLQDCPRRWTRSQLTRHFTAPGISTSMESGGRPPYCTGFLLSKNATSNIKNEKNYLSTLYPVCGKQKDTMKLTSSTLMCYIFSQRLTSFAVLFWPNPDSIKIDYLLWCLSFEREYIWLIEFKKIL